MKTRSLHISILTIEHPAERVFRIACMAAVLVGVGLYMYFVSASIVNIIARKDAVLAISEKTSAIATLEEEYVAHTQLIAEEQPAEFGLVTIESKSFAERSTRLGAVSSVGNEI